MPVITKMLIHLGIEGGFDGDLGHHSPKVIEVLLGFDAFSCFPCQGFDFFLVPVCLSFPVEGNNRQLHSFIYSLGFTNAKHFTGEPNRHRFFLQHTLRHLLALRWDHHFFQSLLNDLGF